MATELGTYTAAPLKSRALSTGFPVTPRVPRSASLIERRRSNERATVSGRDCGGIACKALLSTAKLDPDKLTVDFLPPVTSSGPQLPARRRYTLTHSDVTGELHLSVGCDFNEAQLSGWYLKFIRDEVLAEWLVDEEQSPQLHLFCHISSSRWSAPILPALRNRIFRREMPLVLRAIKYAEQELLVHSPELLSATVFVHFSSHIKALDVLLEWGTLGDEGSWHKPAAAWYELWVRRMLGLDSVSQQQAYGLERPMCELDSQPPSRGDSARRQEESLADTREALESLVSGTSEAARDDDSRRQLNRGTLEPARLQERAVPVDAQPLRVVPQPASVECVAGLSESSQAARSCSSASQELNNIIARGVRCRQ